MNVALPKRNVERSVRSKPYVPRQIAVEDVVAVEGIMAAATLMEATAVEVTMPVEETLVATTAVVVATDRQHHEGYYQTRKVDGKDFELSIEFIS